MFVKDAARTCRYQATRDVHERCLCLLSYFIWKNKIDFKESYEGMDWINLTLDRDKWRALLKKLMIFLIP